MLLIFAVASAWPPCTSLKPTEAGELVEVDIWRYPPHGHDGPDCMIATAADGIIGILALYLARLFRRGGGRRCKEKRRCCRGGCKQKSRRSRKKHVNDVTAQAAAAFVDCVRRAGDGGGWDERTTPPIIRVLLEGRASTREVSSRCMGALVCVCKREVFFEKAPAPNCFFFRR